ncbi:MAG: hypothetical protein Q8P02_00635 [Candidatus Micrarchaeota archaeon]|nr:hypothetical protein [Candidatus Micrarchaeota archaeon]
MNALSALIASAAFIAFCAVFLFGVSGLFSAKEAVLRERALFAQGAWLCVLADSLSRSPDTVLRYAPPVLQADCQTAMRWSDGWVVSRGS